MRVDAFWPQVLGSLSAGRVLDVATGQGQFARLLATHLARYEMMMGVDLQPDQLPAADPDDPPGLCWAVMDVCRLALPDASFDLVSASALLHHLLDPATALAEMLRVLKPGGWLVVLGQYRDDQDAPQQSHVQVHHWAAAIDTALGVPHRPTFLRSQLQTMIEALGLVELTYYTLRETEQEPHDPQVRAEVERALDRYLERATGLPQLDQWRAEADVLRDKVRLDGFLPADRLVAVGRK